MNSLYGTPLTGMRGADFALNVTANNIANLNTSGYEAVEATLANLPDQAAVGDPNNGVAVSPQTRVGMGTQPYSTMRSTEQPQLQATGNPLDAAIGGPGFFTLQDANGQRVYTRQVSLRVQSDGQVATAQGLRTVPPLRVPAGVTDISVDARGQVMGRTRTGTDVRVGTLSVVTFAAPENLQEREGLYSETLGSGRPQAPQAASDITVMSGYQLGSTVDLATEFTNMIESQRMYEMNAKALQTLDSLVNGVVNMQPR